MIARFSRWKVGLACLGSAGFVAASLWLLTIPGGFLVAPFGIAFFGATGLYTLFALVDPRPTLMIDRDGIFDRRTMDRIAPWDEVWGLRPGAMGMLYLDVGPPRDRYTTNPLKRWIGRANGLDADGIVISPLYLNRSPAEVGQRVVAAAKAATPDVTELFVRLVRQARLSEKNLHPCSEAEIAEVTAALGRSLPAAYGTFLGIAGRGAGTLFEGCEVYYPAVLDLQREAAARLAAQSGPACALPDDAFVFLFDEGGDWLAYFLTDDADPEVFTVSVEYFDEPHAVGRFSSFLFGEVSGALRANRGPDG